MTVFLALTSYYFIQMLLNNRYRITRTLGSGGFGETFLAEDTQMPSRRTCVIKQLRPIQENPQVYQLVQQRFGREAAILEELGDGSSQVPRLYAYFSENGQFYLVQEYIEGKTLTQLLQEQSVMNEHSVKEILVGILPVLDYVHSKGIVHRDIKPENILVGIENKPVLIDFGAVKESLGTLLTPSGNITKSIVIGTPGFMSTEQSVGRPMFASDIYSLGLTGIYLLTGKMPQELATDPATGKVLWQQYVPDVSQYFADILDKAIGFHAKERFSSARVMLEALQTGVLPVALGNSNINSSDTIPPGVTLPPQNHVTQNHLSQHNQQNYVPQTKLNTVYLSPPSSIQSGSQGSSKGILLGSLIVGILIGASIIIGFTLNKESQIITKEIQTNTERIPINKEQIKIITQQPQPSASPTLTAEKLQIEPPKITPTPIIIPELKPKVETTLLPRINNDITPEIEPTPTLQEPQTINPKPSPEPEIPVPEEIPLSPPGDFTPPPIQRPSPAKMVENYYLRINQGQFKTAWNQLSTEFKDNKQLHPKGYFSYLSWWKEKVESVAVEKVEVLEENSDTATVNASLSYVMRNRRIVDSSVRFLLVWDTEKNRWVVRDAG